MRNTIVSNDIERIEPDYQQAFAHLAYIVGQLVHCANERQQAQLIMDAKRIVEAAYELPSRFSTESLSMDELQKAIGRPAPRSAPRTSPPAPEDLG